MNYKKSRAINLKWVTPLLLSIIFFSSHSIGQISVKARQVNAKRILNDIEQQSNYRFVYDESSIQFTLVNVELTNASIEHTLYTLFANTDITYKIVKKNILLKNINL